MSRPRHYAFRNPRADDQDCACRPYCLAWGILILGDELHIISQCLATKVVLDMFTAKFLKLARLLGLPHYLRSRRDHTTSDREPPSESLGLHKELHKITFSPFFCRNLLESRNRNPKRTACKQIVNLVAFYTYKCTSGPHYLCLDNYSTEGDNDSTNQTCLLLVESSNP